MPALRAVGPGFDADRAPGADVAQIALEHLAIARTPEVAAADPWGEAGRKILRFHLARMLLQVPATMAGEDPEAIHDMRVSARRVRAAWRVFGNAYDGPVVRRHVAEIRRLGGRLGAVRDLDVQLALLAAHRERRSKRERTALVPLVEAWTAERAERQADLVAHLGSPWFGVLVADHEAFVATDRASEPSEPESPRPCPGDRPDGDSRRLVGCLREGVGVRDRRRRR